MYSTSTPYYSSFFRSLASHCGHSHIQHCTSVFHFARAGDASCIMSFVSFPSLIHSNIPEVYCCTCLTCLPCNLGACMCGTHSADGSSISCQDTRAPSTRQRCIHASRSVRCCAHPLLTTIHNSFFLWITLLCTRIIA